MHNTEYCNAASLGAHGTLRAGPHGMSSKAEWKRLAQEMHRLGIISQLDRAALAAYCQAYGR